MVRIIEAIDKIASGYRAFYCDLWGCLHDGTRALPEAVAALERFRGLGGAVALITNSPRPARDVARQLQALGASPACWDVIASSGDAAQDALARGLFGRRVYHLGPERDLGFFVDASGRPIDVERVPLDQAEAIVCTGLVDDVTETPEDYRATILYGVNKGLKLLCANPDIVVDVGDDRRYCAGAIALAYEQAGGESRYFGKPHPPIYGLTRRRLEEKLGATLADNEILCIGDGIATDIAGAMGEGLDSVFVTGGLAAEETATSTSGGPDPARLEGFLAAARMTPSAAMAFLR